MMRIGIGYDVHRLVPGRPLIIGGVDIPHELGLDGHSDADVLVHAVMDSLLGAMGMRDIGFHFPDTSSQYRGISSMLLLEEVYQMLAKRGFSLGNLDTVVIAQRPRLKDHIPEMIRNMASVLQTEPDRIAVKATTEEGLGFTGTESGIAAWASVLIQKDE